MVDEREPLSEPKEIEKRINLWRGLFTRASYIHYFFGILGVASSAISAATSGSISKICAAISATCIAVIGFSQPDRKYIKFVRAWRILDVAVLRYRYRQIDLPTLINAV